MPAGRVAVPDSGTALLRLALVNGPVVATASSSSACPCSDSTQDNGRREDHRWCDEVEADDGVRELDSDPGSRGSSRESRR